MIIKFLQKLKDYPFPVIGVILAITVLFAIKAESHLINVDGDLVIDSSLDNYISRDSDSYEFFKQMRDVFGNEEMMIVAMQPHPETGFNVDFLKTWSSLPSVFLKKFRES
ncbi:MAG: hypothetical protein HQM12_10845 [SAR324 cluster bacterium]|nr:hypothetical protein [SAR324 cluster bacterium]